jgi:hypothetical protein
MDGWDAGTRDAVKRIPLLTVKAGPRDGEQWTERLKQEMKAVRCTAGAASGSGQAGVRPALRVAMCRVPS